MDSHNWIRGSQLFDSVLYYMLICLALKRKLKIVMVRVMLSKEQVHFILITVCLPDSLSVCLHAF